MMMTVEACCVLTETDPKTVRLRQMAVGADYRVLKGDEFAENIARDHGYRRITMHACKSVLGFYEKVLQSMQ